MSSERRAAATDAAYATHLTHRAALETSRAMHSSDRKATEMDALRRHHRFLRDERERPDSSYEAQVARKYYDSLYKEFAIANLKHYRTRGIALRWRTEDEVVDGIGQFTCANQRCEWHAEPTIRTKLETYEVPFAYEEPGEEGTPVRKQALVKRITCVAPHLIPL
ncbi:hypothetical protein MBRA1_002957 [Malassezia brasiliensis]|uniref:Uncharacterized protein n=1 Tax=Malassezia brasiliensis TaxID=1821822 RepID=A0AAF0IQM9_9BASI|nr:hypothetical protein MBRA1_002957 [Malassezia brasiliensis]